MTRSYETSPHSTGAFKQSDSIYTLVLAANTAQDVPIPANTDRVEISVSQGTWMKQTISTDGATKVAAIPGANITDGSSPELLAPNMDIHRLATDVTHMSFIASAIGFVNIQFFSK